VGETDGIPAVHVFHGLSGGVRQQDGMDLIQVTMEGETDYVMPERNLSYRVGSVESRFGRVHG
jgi:hypothetical protein